MRFDEIHDNRIIIFYVLRTAYTVPTDQARVISARSWVTDVTVDQTPTGQYFILLFPRAFFLFRSCGVTDIKSYYIILYSVDGGKGGKFDEKDQVEGEYGFCC